MNRIGRKICCRKTGRLILIFVSFAATCLLMCSAALAAYESDEISEAEFDGYLFQVNDNIQNDAVLCEDDEAEIEQVLDDIYWTDSVELVQQLEDEGKTEFVEPNYYAVLFDDAESCWSDAMIHTESATALGLDGSGIRIGMVDSGIDAANSDLQQANILEGYDYTLETSEMCDTIYHGTKVAQIIAGADNGAGVTGIAPQAELVPLRCFQNSSATVAILAQAIMDAVDVYGCNVINMSWGIKNNSETLYAAISHAEENGVTMVAAVGNISSSCPSGTVVYPAGYDEVIGVGSVDSAATCAATSMRSTAISVCAPGAGLTFVNAAGEEITSGGTSFAAPAVSAACALLLQHDAELSAENIRELLNTRSADLGEEGWDEQYGYGLIDLAALLEPDSLVQRVSQITGTTASDVSDLAADGNYVYAVGWKISKYDYSDEKNPVLCTSSRAEAASYISAGTDIAFTGIEVYGDYLLVAGQLNDSGETDPSLCAGYFAVLNKSDLSVVWQTGLTGKTGRIVLYDHYAVILCVYPGSALIYDLDDPRSPQPVSEITWESDADGVKHEAQGGCVYTDDSGRTVLAIAGFENGFRFYDISDITQPVLLQTFGMDAFIDSTSRPHTFNCIVNYPYLYATCAPAAKDTGSTSQGMICLNIADLEDISCQLVSVDPVFQYGDEISDRKPVTITQYDHWIIMGAGQMGLAVFDIAEPGNPVFTGYISCGNCRIKGVLATQDGRLFAGDGGWKIDGVSQVKSLYLLQWIDSAEESDCDALGGHDYQVSEVIQPTCADQGYTIYVCSRCGSSYIDDYTEPTGDHVWDAGVVTAEPTMDCEGIMTYTCTICGASMTESIEKLPEDSSLRIVIQPEGGEALVGQTTTITFQAANASGYQWYYSKDDGVSWNRLYWSGAKTNTLTVEYTTARSEYLYKCQVTGSDGTSVYTDSTAITRGTAPDGIITQQPESVLANVGDIVYLQLTAENAVSYQWYYSKDSGNTWSKLYWEGARSEKLTVTASNLRFGYVFHCKIVDGNGKTISSERCYVHPYCELLEQPQNVTAEYGERVALTVSARGVKSYQWYYSKDGGTSWSRVYFTGYRTDTLTVDFNESRLSYSYHCELTGFDGTLLTTDAVRVIKSGNPTVITQQPQNTTAAIGDTVTLSLTAENAAAYQWYYSKDGGSTWTKLYWQGHTTDTLTVDVTAARTNYIYRCSITGNDGGTVISDSITITVH